MKGVSVIICCFNSASRLPATIKHLASQRVDVNVNWEILIINNASKDSTAMVALDEYKKYNISVPFKVVEELRPGLSFAREKGIQEAKYDYLIFCDDDNWLDGHYVQNSYDLMSQNPGIAIAGGTNIPIFEGERESWIDSYLTGYACGKLSEEDRKVTFVYGAGMVLKKSVLNQLTTAGFKSILSDRSGTKLYSGGDAELCKAVLLADYQILYTNLLQLKHFIPKKRTSWAYCKSLFVSFSDSNVLLELYDKALLETPPLINNYYWLKQILYFSFLRLKYEFLKFRLKHKIDDRQREILFASWASQIKIYWNLKTEINNSYNRILNLKSALNASKI